MTESEIQKIIGEIKNSLYFIERQLAKLENPKKKPVIRYAADQVAKIRAKCKRVL
jgi:cob(I)alamin adenosyltransferase